MRNKKEKMWILIILLLSISIIISRNIDNIQNYMQNEKKKMSLPIDINTGMINNEYFGIDSEGKEAEKTTQGLSEAIKYAKDNNISYVKLQQGTYQVIGYNNSHYRGLVMQSNVNLDLNGSKIIQKTNDKIAYANVTMYNIENASISNGVLVGDKETHDYGQYDGTHEGGYGISIIACNNINVNNIEIYDMTGDGINLYGINKGEKISKNVTLENNNIHDCRRQGITVGCGEEILIRNNEIHDIIGTNPQAAIDLEGNFQTELINNVTIKENKIYNLGNINAILLVGFIDNAKIIFNEIEQNILIYDAKETIEVIDNKIKNAIVKFSNDYTNMNAGHNINHVLFKNNQMENSELILSKVADGKVHNNKIKNGKIQFVSSNGSIEENYLENLNDNIEIAIELSNISGHTEKYEVSILNNQVNGNYDKEITIDENYYTIK